MQRQVWLALTCCCSRLPLLLLLLLPFLLASLTMSSELLLFVIRPVIPTHSPDLLLQRGKTVNVPINPEGLLLMASTPVLTISEDQVAALHEGLT